MKKLLYGVYGSSGYGREVMPLARDQLARQGISTYELVFIDDQSTSSVVNGHRVLTYTAFLEQDAEDRYVAFAIADSSIRSRLWASCEADGMYPWTVTAANAVFMDDVEIGPGAILNPFVTLTSNVRVGRGFHANIYSYVAHDCTIGDFVTFAPGVKCNGNIIIEDYAYIGTGAILKQGTPSRPLLIGRNAVVGMGAVVTRDVSPNTTVVGNPAKLFAPGK